MESQRILKLMKYLYPTDEIRNFMFNDLNIELSAYLPKEMIISAKNSKDIIRTLNKGEALHRISVFFEQNSNYLKQVCELYGKTDISDMLGDILQGYALFIIINDEKYKNVDIFKDKKSVCYTLISAVDYT